MATDRQFVTALSRGLDLLACFSAARPVLTNGELAAMTGLACSSVSRLSHTLIKLGYLEYEAATGAYRLGLRVMAMQPAALAGAGIADGIFPRMQELAATAGATALLSVIEADTLLVVQSAAATAEVSAWRFLGLRYPLTGTASGRAYMASCGSQELERIVDHLGQGREDKAAGIREEAACAADSYRRRGFCDSLGIVPTGSHNIAVPLQMRDLGRRMTLCCSGPPHRLPQRHLYDRVAPALLDTAAEIERTSARRLRTRPAGFDAARSATHH